MDVMMPEMDGMEACENIRKIPENEIIALTARSEDYSQVAGFDAGADDYITKPIKPKLLVSESTCCVALMKSCKTVIL
jgi:two-component system alkaline phosphatase synthesis response regulator PhoP